MNVHLTPELEQFVQAKVESGRYNSASEVVSEALLLMQQNDEFHAIHLQELHNRMDIALSESARGEGTDGEQFIQDMLQDLDVVAEIVKPSAKSVPSFGTLHDVVQMTPEQFREATRPMTEQEVDAFVKGR